MAPRVEFFDVSQLESRVQYDVNGKKRREPVDLTKCRLQELIQYRCDVEKEFENDRRGRIRCDPLLRTFRRCANGLSVETTAWEKVLDDEAEN